jgi:hypothetical protein
VTVESQKIITDMCDEIKSILLEKNRKYGNSALDPVRVFSTSDPIEQLRVRIDDKLSRIVNNQNDEDEDVILDLIGYLVLLKIAMDDKKDKDVSSKAEEFADTQGGNWVYYNVEVSDVPAKWSTFTSDRFRNFR